MNTLPTAAELVDDMRKYPELRVLLERKAVWGLLNMAEHEETTCENRWSQENYCMESISQHSMGGQDFGKINLHANS